MMLTLAYKKGETFSLVHPDGTQMHGLIVRETAGQVRIAWEVPKTVKICRDTIQAKRDYEVVSA